MPIEAMNDADLLAFHQETLAKARTARTSGALDVAQSHLRVLTHVNGEIQRRMAVLNARRTGALFA